MAILLVGVGFLMLIAGRPIYTVFVGSIGFVTGSYLADWITIFPSDTNKILLSLLFAAISVIFTQFYKRWAVRIAGLIGGAILILNLPHAFGSEANWISPYLVAAVAMVSFALLIIIFDFALIALSSLLAATLILSNMRLGNLDQGVMFLILTAFGIIVQFLILQYASHTPD